jgi:hypothetical protein
LRVSVCRCRCLCQCRCRCRCVIVARTAEQDGSACWFVEHLRERCFRQSPRSLRENGTRGGRDSITNHMCLSRARARQAGSTYLDYV